ncbi:MAG: pilus assembly protein MshP [Gammaproteobacteria bacterium]|nr:pilus assembly protein MshP [Gammaproteobacteria bacterium]
MNRVFRRIRQAGFTLVTALFLLVVVALLSVYMINFSAVQHTTLVYGLQGARAMQAAHAGLEWGIYQAFDANACPGSTPFTTGTGGQIDNFTIQLSCVRTTHIEAATTIITYQLTSQASIGTFGSLDYIFRSLQATVSNQPP